MIGIPKLGEMAEAVGTAIKSTWAQMTEIFTVEHNEDGQHTDITARSITLTTDTATGATGAVTAGGSITAGDSVTANVGESGSLTQAGECVLGEYVANASVAGSAVSLGKAADQEAWAMVASAIRGSSPGASASLEFIARKDSSTYRRAMSLAQADTPASGEYYLLPSITGKLSLGAPSAAFGGFSGAARFEAAYLNAVFEAGRTAAMGYPTSPAYNAANFTASAGNWTVDSGDITTYAYTQVGQTMTVFFEIESTDVSAAPNTLQIAIPASAVAAQTTRAICQVIDAGGTATAGVARVVATGTQILIQPTVAGTAAWTTTAADNTSVRGQITFPIQ